MTKITRMCDLMGFLNWQGKPPEADPSIANYVKLMHVTSAPPSRRDESGMSVPLTTDFVMECHYIFRQKIDSNPYLLSVVNKDDLARIGENKTGIIYGIQHAPEDIINGLRLDDLYQSGINVITPCYQGLNKFGAGFLYPDIPLTDDGIKLVNMCEEIGMIVDVSHCGHRTASDIIKIMNSRSNPKIIASHTGLFERYPNPRNLTREIINRIMYDFDGLVGVYGLTFGLTNRGSNLEFLYGHLGDIAFGDTDTDNVDISDIKNVCIGTDGIYKNLDYVEWQDNITRMIAMVDPDKKMGARFPDMPFELNCVSKLQVIENYLQTQADDGESELIESIMVNNMWSYFLKNL